MCHFSHSKAAAVSNLSLPKKGERVINSRLIKLFWVKYCNNIGHILLIFSAKPRVGLDDWSRASDKKK